MELQWDKQVISCLRHKTREVQNQEMTQELRLSDGMPDVGRVICVWGQPVLRSKEWNGDGMRISGGVMTWVLYAPEDGSEPRSTECWLPFQMRWNFPQSRRDGSIRADIRLRGADARVLSARKIMVRAAVSVLGEALEPENVEFYTPGAVPEDLQLLRMTYPMQRMAEAGEKVFLLDEDVPFDMVRPRKIVSYCIDPFLSESKVLGGKAAFRGVGHLHLVYLGEDDALHSFNAQLPFAQYTDLDRDYDKDADISVCMSVSSLEADVGENGLRVKCGLIAQYMVMEQLVMEVAEDAYSVTRKTEPLPVDLDVPVVLDRFSKEMESSVSLPVLPEQIIDVCLFADQPVQNRTDNAVELEAPSLVQVLYRQNDGTLACHIGHALGQLSVSCDEDSALTLYPLHCGNVRMESDGQQTDIRFDTHMELIASSQQKMRVMAGVRLGDPVVLVADRPSLILRRPNSASLWELAKMSGSTVSAIQKTNGLDTEPPDGQMLLIPVL